MSGLRYEYQIPDPSRPLPGEVPSFGPSCELTDFRPGTVTPELVVGRTIDEVCTHVGTYGMGGPGFFGLRLGSEWLVVAIWGAASWIEADGRIVEDGFWDTSGRHRPWITDEGDELTERLVSQSITSFAVAGRSLVIGVGGVTLTIAESPEHRPILQGNKQPRAFEAGDDLRRAVFLSPTAEIWV